jgi:hypothetical protein
LNGCLCAFVFPFVSFPVLSVLKVFALSFLFLVVWEGCIRPILIETPKVSCAVVVDGSIGKFSVFSFYPIIFVDAEEACRQLRPKFRGDQ